MSRKYFLKDPLHPEGGFYINVKRKKDCVFCDHCTDIFWDYTNLIYGIVCSEDMIISLPSASQNLAEPNKTMKGSDLISRQDAIEAVCRTRCREKAKGCPAHSCHVIEEFDALPSAEPKTGEWVLKEHLWECDQCGCRINRANPLKGNVWNYNFCPNCGARMKGEEE